MDFINFMGPVITGISAIALALFLFFIVDSIQPFFARLIKASSTLDLVSFLDLWISYYSQFILYLFIIINTGLYSLDEMYRKGVEPVILAILTILYFGRIVSKSKGAFYGKLHFTALITSSLFLIILKYANNALNPILSGEFVITHSYSTIADAMNEDFEKPNYRNV